MRRKYLLSTFIIILIAIFILLPGMISKADVSIETYKNEICNKLNSKGNITFIWKNKNDYNEINLMSNDFLVIADRIARTKFYFGEEIGNNFDLIKKGNAVVVTKENGQLSTSILKSKENKILDSITNDELYMMKIKKAENILLVDITDNNDYEVFSGDGNIENNINTLDKIISEYERMGWGE